MKAMAARQGHRRGFISAFVNRRWMRICEVLQVTSRDPTHHHNN